MTKALFILILSFLVAQVAKAQKRDSILLYMTNHDKIVDTKDSADYFLLIMSSADSSSRGLKISDVKEFYMNKQPKLVGTAVIYVNGQTINMSFEGPRIDFYPNGHRESISTYKNGKQVGGVNEYYPNGHLHSIVDYNQKGDMKFVECSDTSGNVIAENGKGKWIDLDWDTKKTTSEGFISDSLRDGEWKGITTDSGRYVCLFNKGKSVSGIGYDKEGMAHPFTNFEVEPLPNGGPKGFNQFLANTIKFPAIDRQNGTQGKVIVTFVVDKDGHLKDVTALRGPSKTMEEAAIIAVASSPRWQPGLLYGIPVRVQYTISFAFSLADKYQ